MTKLRTFQKQFIKAVENPKYDTVAISGPRSLGKTFIAAHVLTRCMTPGDVLHQPGKEYILGAASLEQARLTYAFIRETLEPTGEYRWIDSTTRTELIPFGFKVVELFGQVGREFRSEILGVLGP